jgi:hypothetical protein
MAYAPFWILPGECLPRLVLTGEHAVEKMNIPALSRAKEKISEVCTISEIFQE